MNSATWAAAAPVEAAPTPTRKGASVVTERTDHLTVVIASRNRAAFLVPLLEYYASSGLGSPLIIGDSSEDNQATMIQAAVERLDGQLPIRYSRYPTYADQAPGMGFIHCVTGLLRNHVTTKYAVVAADDDFLIPGALGEAVEFLEAHPDYSTVHGKALLVISPEGAGDGVVGTQRYPQRTITGPSAAERLRNHFANCTATEYSVKRTAQALAHWEATVAVIEEQFLGELLRSSLGVIDGKVHQLDRLYMVRRGHGRMTSRRGRDCFDRLVDPAWPRQYVRFRDCLAEALHLQDGLSQAEGCEVVKEALWAYLAEQMVRKWQGCYRGQDAWRTLRARLRELPWLRRTWQTVSSRLPGDANTMRLRALLRPASPYHRDFLPIYHTITQRHAQAH